MLLTVSRVIFVGGTLVLWLALSMPPVAFFLEAWIPAAAWLALGAMAVSPHRLARLLGVDDPTYGSIAAAVGALIPTTGALLAAAALFVARYVGTGESSIGNWATSPVLGAVFLLLIMLTLLPMLVMQNRTLGSQGTTPIDDGRGQMRSSAPAPKSAADFNSMAHDASQGPGDKHA